MFTGLKSAQGLKATQVYTTNYGWACTYNMKQKGKVHENVSTFFHCEGVPPVMICDDLKEQHSKDFKRKLN
jgi:hypothetical protein